MKKLGWQYLIQYLFALPNFLQEEERGSWSLHFHLICCTGLDYFHCFVLTIFSTDSHICSPSFEKTREIFDNISLSNESTQYVLSPLTDCWTSLIN